MGVWCRVGRQASRRVDSLSSHTLSSHILSHTLSSHTLSHTHFPSPHLGSKSASTTSISSTPRGRGSSSAGCCPPPPPPPPRPPPRAPRRREGEAERARGGMSPHRNVMWLGHTRLWQGWVDGWVGEAGAGGCLCMWRGGGWGGAAAESRGGGEREGHIPQPHTCCGTLPSPLVHRPLYRALEQAP